MDNILSECINVEESDKGEQIFVQDGLTFKSEDERNHISSDFGNTSENKLYSTDVHIKEEIEVGESFFHEEDGVDRHLKSIAKSQDVSCEQQSDDMSGFSEENAEKTKTTSGFELCHSETTVACSSGTFNENISKNISVNFDRDEYKRHCCPHCDYRTVRKTNLKIHIRTHTGEKPYQCPYCDSRFSKKTGLNAHTRTHTGEKPFKCELCDYRSARYSALRRHILTHTGEKPFECHHCDYRSTTKKTLICHILTHIGEKPFKCPYCDYSSVQRGNLNYHIMIHTGEKPFECPHCKDRFSRNEHLKRHIRTNHTHPRKLQKKLKNQRQAVAGIHPFMTNI